jgi:hypothetical protein
MKTREANLRTRIRNYRLAIVRDRRWNTRKVVGVRDLDYWPKLICSEVRAEQKRNELFTIVISEDRDLRDSVAAARRRYRPPRCLHRSARRLVVPVKLVRRSSACASIPWDAEEAVTTKLTAKPGISWAPGGDLKPQPPIPIRVPPIDRPPEPAGRRKAQEVRIPARQTMEAGRPLPSF